MAREITDTHDLYEEHDVKEFLTEDADRLRAFIGESGKQLQVV